MTKVFHINQDGVIGTIDCPEKPVIDICPVHADGLRCEHEWDERFICCQTKYNKALRTAIETTFVSFCEEDQGKVRQHLLNNFIHPEGFGAVAYMGSRFSLPDNHTYFNIPIPSHREVRQIQVLSHTSWNDYDPQKHTDFERCPVRRTVLRLKETAMSDKREPGFYWVKTTIGWTIGEWYDRDVMGDAVHIWRMPFTNKVYVESDFTEIGPRIPAPSEGKEESEQGEKWNYHWSYGPSHRHTIRKKDEEFYLAVQKEGAYSEDHKKFAESICDKLNSVPSPALSRAEALLKKE